MAKFIGNPEFKHGTKLKIGVLLSNLGTPDKPQSKELRVSTFAKASAGRPVNAFCNGLPSEALA